LANNGINIIAEFKRRSPSKGTIRENADAATIARSYQCGGAAAISVLTEENYFAGSLDDLRQVRNAVTIPILRKDFIFDEYQILETAAAGADALLLIVAALDDEKLSRLLRLTEDELGMDALVEVHTKEEMHRAVAIGAKLIGVNNRDLRTFVVSTQTSFDLASLAPAESSLISESGLDPSAVRALQAVGYKGFLIGEALMRAQDPERELRIFNGNTHEAIA
jgi:indole-3-glycerol phosphate synthase